MTKTTTPKSLTVRLPAPLYRAATEIAKRRAQSMNTLVLQGLEILVREEEERSRYNAYSLLGQDTAECDVEYAIHAQAEVMLHDDV